MQGWNASSIIKAPVVRPINIVSFGTLSISVIFHGGVSRGDAHAPAREWWRVTAPPRVRVGRVDVRHVFPAVVPRGVFPSKRRADYRVAAHAGGDRTPAVESRWRVFLRRARGEAPGGGRRDGPRRGDDRRGGRFDPRRVLVVHRRRPTRASPSRRHPGIFPVASTTPLQIRGAILQTHLQATRARIREREERVDPHPDDRI